MEPAESVDQVPRLQAFRDAHPEIDIRPPRRGDPFWTATREGTRLTSGVTLKRFLDNLEELAGQ
jgi:hypothetical protein